MISIIVPVYNVKEYLDASIQSIINQTYSDLEIMIIDDGSTDGSGRLCDEWAEKDHRIRVFHKTNGGTSSARNYGLERSRGEYIAFVDSDDMIDVNMMQHLYDAIQKEQADVAACYECVFTDDDEINAYYESCQEIKTENHEQYLWHFNEPFRGVVTWVWNKLYARKTIENLAFDEKMKKMEDVVFSSKIALNSQKCVWIPERLYFYRQRKGSLMHDVKLDLVQDYLSAIEVEFESLRNEASELFQSEHLKRCLSLIHAVSKQAKAAKISEGKILCKETYEKIYQGNKHLIRGMKSKIKYSLYQHMF